MILGENEAKVCLYVLLKAHLQLTRDFASPLTVTVCHCEEVAVFETTEVRHSDPSVLVCLMGVRWRLTCLGSESKLSDAVCKHLLRVC